MQFVTMRQAAHDFADFADLADDRTRVTVFDVDARARLDAVRSVVAVVRNVAGAVLDEIVLGRETCAFDSRLRC